MSNCKHCSGIGGYHSRYCPTLHAARVDQAANDPSRIDSSKSIAPALTVPRNTASETEVNAS